jgi:hypothetical protein
MPVDSATLSRILESGQYDTYVKQMLEGKYGRGKLSPFLMQDMQQQAQPMMQRILAENLVSRGPSILNDPQYMEAALQSAVDDAMNGRGRGGNPALGPQLMGKLSEWRNADPMSAEGIVGSALYNDPATLKALILASMPRGYGGVFNKAYTNAIGEGINEAQFMGPEQGDYVTRIAKMLSGLTQQPSNIAPAMIAPAISAPTALGNPYGPLPDTAEAINAIQARERPQVADPLSNITPEELFALRQLAGE